MVRKISKKNHEGLEISLGKITSGLLKGVGSLFALAANLEKEGKSEHEETGEITGKTKSGKAYKGVYGFRVKVGLNEKLQAPSTKFQIKPNDQNSKF